MSKGYNKIFWGLFLAMFHINLGRIDILPKFVGFIMVGLGINKLIKFYDNQNFHRAVKYCAIISLILIIEFGINFLGLQFAENTIIINLVMLNITAILKILLMVNIFEGSIDGLKKLNLPGSVVTYERKIRNYIVCYSVIIIFNNINNLLNNMGIGAIILGMILIIEVSMMILIKGLGKEEWNF